MGIDELRRAWRNGGKIALPYFGGSKVSVFFEDESELAESASAVLAFLSLGTKDRDAASRHPFSYFSDFAEQVGFRSGWIAEGMDRFDRSDARIWNYVHPFELTVGRAWDIGNPSRERIYVMVEADCGWEEEHGLQMSWREGTELVRVSSYDGHPTNGYAYDDPAKDAFVYYATQPEWHTLNPAMPAAATPD